MYLQKDLNKTSPATGYTPAYQARMLDGSGGFTAIKSFDKQGMCASFFPVRATPEEAIKDLQDLKADGEVMRFVKPGNVSFDDETILSFTAGIEARYWHDTSATDSDLDHFTQEEWEAKGYVVFPLYAGPFPLDKALSINNELKEKVTDLGIVKLGGGYNPCQIIAPQ